MKLSVEVYSEKPLFINDGSFIKLNLRIHGMIFRETKGVDHYYCNFCLLTGKRFGGIGRCIEYRELFIPGINGMEAKPGAFIEINDEYIDDVWLVIETNIILDPGLLRENTGVRVINGAGKGFDIPLKRPDIEITWSGRGRYIIPVTPFITSRLFSCMRQAE